MAEFCYAKPFECGVFADVQFFRVTENDVVGGLDFQKDFWVVLDKSDEVLVDQWHHRVVFSDDVVVVAGCAGEAG